MANRIFLTKFQASKTDPTPLYVTRDSDDETGELSHCCEVWGKPPVRTKAPNGLGASWMPACLEDADSIIGRYSVEAIKLWIRNACPGTDRECVVVP